LKKGDTCLVHAAAGGVGLLLCQIAKLRGARVIGTVSTDEKAKLAREAGADETIIYTRQDFEAEVKRMTDGKGVQVVYDAVGKTTWDKSLNSLAPRGLVALYGASSGPIGQIDPQIFNVKGSLFMTRRASVTTPRPARSCCSGPARCWAGCEMASSSSGWSSSSRSRTRPRRIGRSRVARRPARCCSRRDGGPEDGA